MTKIKVLKSQILTSLCTTCLKTDYLFKPNMVDQYYAKVIYCKVCGKIIKNMINADFDLTINDFEVRSASS